MIRLHNNYVGWKATKGKKIKLPVPVLPEAQESKGRGFPIGWTGIIIKKEVTK